MNKIELTSRREDDGVIIVSRVYYPDSGREERDHELFRTLDNMIAAAGNPQESKDYRQFLKSQIVKYQ